MTAKQGFYGRFKSKQGPLWKQPFHIFIGDLGYAQAGLSHIEPLCKAYELTEAGKIRRPKIHDVRQTLRSDDAICEKCLMLWEEVRTSDD